jgi:hypothetical protein
MGQLGNCYVLSDFRYAGGLYARYWRCMEIWSARYLASCQTPRMKEDPRRDSYEATISRNDRARVVPGNALASELFRRIKGHALPGMPLYGPPYLNENEIRLIEKWINDGARDAAGNPAPEMAGAPVRLHGKLTRKWVLDGLELVLNSKTRIKKSADTGNYVRVRGHVAGDGPTIIVDRIQAR